MPICSRLRLIVATGLALGVLLPPASADAAPVVNAGFDTDLAGWSNPFGRPAAWDPLDSPDCLGDPVGMHFDSQFSADTSWRLIGGEVPAHPLVQAIRVWLAISKPSGVSVPVFVQFDDVYLVADRIFGNGFQP